MHKFIVVFSSHSWFCCYLNLHVSNNFKNKGYTFINSLVALSPLSGFLSPSYQVFFVSLSLVLPWIPIKVKRNICKEFCGFPSHSIWCRLSLRVFSMAPHPLSSCLQSLHVIHFRFYERLHLKIVAENFFYRWPNCSVGK